jgi:hypothetical protein
VNPGDSLEGRKVAEVFITAAEVFIGRAGKFNHYQEGERREGRSCHTCIRRRFSFPYTCEDGWPLLSKGPWEDRGATCLNWSDNPQCQVD